MRTWRQPWGLHAQVQLLAFPSALPLPAGRCLYASRNQFVGPKTCPIGAINVLWCIIGAWAAFRRDPGSGVLKGIPNSCASCRLPHARFEPAIFMMIVRPEACAHTEEMELRRRNLLQSHSPAQPESRGGPMISWRQQGHKALGGW